MPVILESTASAKTPRPSVSVLFLLTILTLTACISLPDRVVSQMSQRGAVSIKHHAFGPLSVIETYSIIPGTLPVGHSPSGHVKCEATRAELEISWVGDSLSREEASTACQLGIRSLSHVARYSRTLQEKVSFRLRFFPHGSSVRFRDYSLVGPGKISPLIAKPIGLTNRDAERATLMTLPHEAVHIAVALDGFAWSLEEEERIAYIAGYCSAWATEGDIDDDWLSVGRFPQPDEVPASALRSSNTGYETAAEVRAILRAPDAKDGEIDAAMNDYCDRHLRPLLDGQIQP